VLQGPYPTSDVIYDQVTLQSSLVEKFQTRRIETTWDGGINFGAKAGKLPEIYRYRVHVNQIVDGSEFI
jgi:hypothetical protein